MKKNKKILKVKKNKFFFKSTIIILGLFLLNPFFLWSNPIEKQFWSEYQQLLNKIVTTNNFEYRRNSFVHSGVNYQKLYDDESERWIDSQTTKLNRFNLQNLENNKKNIILAFWINVYNFFTVWEIKRHYPISSMKKIGWDNKIVLINGKKLTLDEVEHKIIRRLGDPRIHFAINCASVSCPTLHTRIFEGNLLNKQLDYLVKNALKNPLHLRVETGFLGKKMTVTKIFYWFGEDFGKKRNILNFIHQYGPPFYKQFNTYYSSISYDWDLNSQQNIIKTLNKLLLNIPM